jgi:hypothetical protein
MQFAACVDEIVHIDVRLELGITKHRPSHDDAHTLTRLRTHSSFECALQA